MNLAITHNPPLDSYSAWQATHGAAWCHSLSATITAATCAKNQEYTGLDCRCNGCGGLNNQVPPQQTLPALALVWDADKTTVTDRLPTTPDKDLIEGLDALDEIIDGLYEDPAPGDNFEDIDLELDDEELLKLFPELAGDDDPEKLIPQRFTSYQEAAPRRAVYHGRCERCTGYMENVSEWHDDNVFRCNACGWRTGPAYQRNRAIHAAGGMR
jgi:hypothetical protein